MLSELVRTVIIFPRISVLGLCFVKVLRFFLGLVWCFHSFLDKCLPIKVLKPNVILNFRGTIQTQSVARFPLQTLIDEISCFQRPALWEFVTFDADLLRKKHVPYLFASTADIGPASHHEFVSNHTKCKVVNSVGMILAAHNLRRHIARCSRSVRCVVCL